MVYENENENDKNLSTSAMYNCMSRMRCEKDLWFEICDGEPV